MTDRTEVLQAAEWRQTACILCACNCGVEIRLGGDGRTFERVRGDKAHPASKGYTCEKALRLDYYQNARGERLLSPLRRRPDGTYEEIDWDTAIREVAERLAAVRRSQRGDVRDRHAGDRDRGDGRLPPPGAARPRCLAHRRHCGGARR